MSRKDLPPPTSGNGGVVSKNDIRLRALPKSAPIIPSIATNASAEYRASMNGWFRMLTPRITSFALGAACVILSTGCATIRITDPPRTADEQFLLSTAAARAVAQLSTDTLRDRKVWVDSSYFNAPEQAFVIGEMRSKLLLGGVRLVPDRKDAQIVIEVRSGGVGINRTEFLLGLPSIPIPGINSGSSSVATAVPFLTPELAILKNTKQRGFAAVAYVAYWADTGEVVTSSGPFIGRTIRDDSWFFGAGPRTIGNVPTTEK